jgi:DNA sulfur modification protein DndC
LGFILRRQLSLFESDRLRLDGAIELSLASLSEYGQRYRHWCVAYSGGKDSSATVLFVAWAIKTGQVAPPESLTVLYADTRMELPPLQQTAMELLGTLQSDGFKTQVVLPEIDSRFYVYMFGRGVPPSSNRFRWCTPKLKIEPMHRQLATLREQSGEKLLMLTGVRMGESAARDQRIAVSCSKDSGECGQGWFQVATPESVADTLAPLLHWRLCHVYDWIYFEQGQHGYDVSDIALIYGDGEVRTGCVGCPLASRDVALERLIKKPGQEKYLPLMELKPLYRELKKPQYRLRKSRAELRKDGRYSKNAQRLGPLTFEARAYGLDHVLDIQHRAGVDLINSEEEARIRQLWKLNTWPDGWLGDEITGDVAIDAIRVTPDNSIVTQALLVR